MQEKEEMKAKSMLEKLKEDYERSEKQGNKGHAIGFYDEIGEPIKPKYEFPKGKYAIRASSNNFFWWNYQANENERKGEQIHRRFRK